MAHAFDQPPQIDVIVPVHNEADSITQTLREFHRVVAVAAGLPFRFIVSEDGSIDGTPDIVRDLSDELPLLLVTSPSRKGYSQAVVDAMMLATAPWVGCLDGDGQYDPCDFVQLYERRKGNDLVVGYRSPREDPKARIAMSAAFGGLYRTLFTVNLKDPSCPYGIVRQAALRRILGDTIPLLPQGFWWGILRPGDSRGTYDRAGTHTSPQPRIRQYTRLPAYSNTADCGHTFARPS